MRGLSARCLSSAIVTIAHDLSRFVGVIWQEDAAHIAIVSLLRESIQIGLSRSTGDIVIISAELGFSAGQLLEGAGVGLRV